MKTNLKTKICSIILFFLFRALKYLSLHDSIVRSDWEKFDENFVISIYLSEGGKSLRIIKKNGKMKRIRISGIKEDLAITFKSADAAFLVFTGFSGLSRAYSEHRFTLSGNISDGMAFVRMVERAETYLFPSIMGRRILRRREKKEMMSVAVYLHLLLGV